MAKRLIFILGGARSGKSTYAEQWARDHAEQVLFVATAQRSDDEMAARIAAHRASRPTHWQTLEAPRHIAPAIRAIHERHEVVLLDCLTLLTANILLAMPEGASQAEIEAATLEEIEALHAVYAESAATWLVISNEVGMGLVPPYPLGRAYRDALGRVNQRMAESADEVRLMIAGLPWLLKPPPTG